MSDIEHLAQDEDPNLEARIEACDAVNAIINGYVEDYEFIGEAAETGEEVTHAPTVQEKYLIKDAIHRLTSDSDFIKAWDKWRSLCDPRALDQTPQP